MESWSNFTTVLEELTYSFIQSPISRALDEIHHDIWTIDLPIDVFRKWVIDHRFMKFPKKKQRWLNLLKSDFSWVIVTVPLYKVQHIYRSLKSNTVGSTLLELFTHIVTNARTTPGTDTCTVLIHVDTEKLYTSLTKRNLLSTCLYTNRVYLNTHLC